MMISEEFKKHLTNNLRSVGNILSNIKAYDELDLDIFVELVNQVKSVAELVYPNDTLGILMLEKLSELDNSDEGTSSYCVELLEAVTHELKLRLADINDGNYSKNLKLLPANN